MRTGTSYCSKLRHCFSSSLSQFQFSSYTNAKQYVFTHTTPVCQGWDVQVRQRHSIYLNIIYTLQIHALTLQQDHTTSHSSLLLNLHCSTSHNVRSNLENCAQNSWSIESRCFWINYLISHWSYVPWWAYFEHRNVFTSHHESTCCLKKYASSYHRSVCWKRANCTERCLGNCRE